MCGPGSSLLDPVCRADGNNRLKLEVIYFISWDYKFNLQTRGQNFSLTRGRELLQALVQEETTLITNYTFQSVFDVLLPSSLLFFGRGADFNCGTTTRLPPSRGAASRLLPPSEPGCRIGCSSSLRAHFNGSPFLRGLDCFPRDSG